MHIGWHGLLDGMGYDGMGHWWQTFQRIVISSEISEYFVVRQAVPGEEIPEVLVFFAGMNPQEIFVRSKTDT